MSWENHGCSEYDFNRAINTSEDVIDFVKITKIKMVEDASILADKMRRTWSIGLISFGIGLAIMMMESIV